MRLPASNVHNEHRRFHFVFNDLEALGEAITGVCRVIAMHSFDGLVGAIRGLEQGYSEGRGGKERMPLIFWNYTATNYLLMYRVLNSTRNFHQKWREILTNPAQLPQIYFPKEIFLPTNKCVFQKKFIEKLAKNKPASP